MTATLLRTVIVYILVVVGIRIMGKRQIGELQPGELVITIMISECAAFPIQDLSRPVANGIFSVFTLIILEIVLSYLTRGMPFLRRIIEGKPTVIIDHGKIDIKAMKKLRLNVDDLTNNLRQQGYFDLNDVAFAVLETNGKISVLPTEDQQTATAGMVGGIGNGTCKEMPCIVIDSGNIRDNSLSEIGMNKSELKNILKTQKIKPDGIFLMTVGRDRNIYIAKNDKGDSKN